MHTVEKVKFDSHKCENAHRRKTKTILTVRKCTLLTVRKCALDFLFYISPFLDEFIFIRSAIKTPELCFFYETQFAKLLD